MIGAENSFLPAFRFENGMLPIRVWNAAGVTHCSAELLCTGGQRG
jgi:hypothetical protein